MPAKAFVDTNMFIYVYSEDEQTKSEIASDAMENYDCVISTQVLNEFSNICIRKLQKTSEEVKLAIDEMRTDCIVLSITNTTIYKALEVHTKYSYSYYDCLMIASALESNCKYLLSEDMSDGQVIEGTLIIKNVFKSANKS
jgi:predicted nucleic acid-binding protein